MARTSFLAFVIVCNNPHNDFSAFLIEIAEKEMKICSVNCNAQILGNIDVERAENLFASNMCIWSALYVHVMKAPPIISARLIISKQSSVLHAISSSEKRLSRIIINCLLLSKKRKQRKVKAVIQLLLVALRSF